MSQMFLYDHIKKYIPNLTANKAELIRSYWFAFWEYPDRYDNTDLPHIISEWLEKEMDNWEINEWGDFVRKDKNRIKH